jgi:hypothetical protein
LLGAHQIMLSRTASVSLALDHERM